MTITEDGRTILSNITWETYECLLKNYENQSAVRLTYNEGMLEIMSPLLKHEKNNRAIADIVTIILDVWDWEFISAGSTTFKQALAAKGFEPDSCFFIANEDKIRDNETVDVAAGDPPPDLVIEIDLTSSSLSRQPIFVAFGVPEVWRYAKKRLTILTLTGNGYAEQIESVAVPGLPASQITAWLTDLPTMRRSAWTKEIRAWATQNQLAPPLSQ